MENKYTELSEIERKTLLTKIGTYCHESNEFYDNIISLIEGYQGNSDSKVGLEEIIPQ